MYVVPKSASSAGVAAYAAPATASTTVRRKIIPSVDLLHDCYLSDASAAEADEGSGAAGSRPSTAAASSSGGSHHWTSLDNESVSIRTPESLTTSDLFDDSAFDGELDWIGITTMCNQQEPTT